MKKQFKSVVIGILICIVCFGFFPANSKNSSGTKNIVIVHAAFADASGWEAVYNILTNDGYHVTLVQSPLTSLEADIAATKHENRVAIKRGATLIIIR